MFRWLRLNGEIIGCEEDGTEYTMFAMRQNNRLMALYHEEIKKKTIGG